MSVSYEAGSMLMDGSGPGLLDGVEKVYSTSEAARFFSMSNQWLYWGMRNNIFTYLDGTPIQPERIGKGGRRRFTLPIIREMALSCHRRGNLKQEGVWEASTGKGKGKTAVKALDEFGAREAFVHRYGHEPDAVTYTPGLRDVLTKIARAERGEMVV
jgi:hypothetical protein